MSIDGREAVNPALTDRSLPSGRGDQRERPVPASRLAGHKEALGYSFEGLLSDAVQKFHLGLPPELPASRQPVERMDLVLVTPVFAP